MLFVASSMYQTDTNFKKADDIRRDIRRSEGHFGNAQCKLAVED
jgi:hypothetical protein